MSENGNHIKNYTADDIQRYHEGLMSPAERHLLEKTALDDPFLADAIDGYLYNVNAKADLEQIRELIADKALVRQPEREKDRYIWLKIAASFILIAGTAWYFINFSGTNEKDMALQTTPSASDIKMPQQEVRAPVEAAATKDSTSQFLLPENSVTNKREREPAKPGSFKKPSINARKESPGITVSADTGAGDTDANRNMSVRNMTAAKRNMSPAIHEKINYFNGRVVDMQNTPLPYASIVTKDKQTFMADNNGNFIITSKDTAINAEVIVQGYASNATILHSEKPVTIVMKDHEASLNEVVVMKKDNTKDQNLKRAVPITDSLETDDSWTVFNEYVSKKLSDLKDPGLNSINGEVKLSFDINNKGEPVNIKVEKSLCEKCDKEAIRLLKEGPRWKKTRIKKASVSIRF